VHKGIFDSGKQRICSDLKEDFPWSLTLVICFNVVEGPLTFLYNGIGKFLAATERGKTSELTAYFTEVARSLKYLGFYTSLANQLNSLRIGYPSCDNQIGFKTKDLFNIDSNSTGYNFFVVLVCDKAIRSSAH